MVLGVHSLRISVAARPNQGLLILGFDSCMPSLNQPFGFQLKPFRSILLDRGDSLSPPFLRSTLTSPFAACL